MKTLLGHDGNISQNESLIQTLKTQLFVVLVLKSNTST